MSPRSSKDSVGSPSERAWSVTRTGSPQPSSLLAARNTSRRPLRNDCQTTCSAPFGSTAAAGRESAWGSSVMRSTDAKRPSA
jgi:hypothetical protein